MSLKKMVKKKIGTILIEEGLLKPKDLELALATQKKDGGLIGSILVKMRAVTEEDLVFALSKQLGIPFIRLRHYNVNRRALQLIPKETAELYLVFPFEHDEHSASIAMADPLNQEALETLEKKIPSRIQVFLATVTEVREAIGTYYGEKTPQLQKG